MAINSNETKIVLHLILPLAQVNEAVDVLLAQTPELFFSVTEIQGYGQPQQHLSIREQVAGFQKKAQIQIECEQAVYQSILHELKNEMPSATISYRVIPLWQTGQL